MDVKDILSRCDHTLLAQGATWAEIRALCDDGVRYGCASVCIPASYVKQAAEYLGGKLPVCTNIGWAKDGRWEDLLSEIRAVKAACGDHILKVILECCLLTEAEKIKLCEIVTESGADFIKTSTGFGGGGATREDVALMAAHVGPKVKIKAAGGIASLEDAADFIRLGADRLGTSRVVKAVKAMEAAK